MSIRRINKDHLKELAPPITLIEKTPSTSSPEEDPLRFWTKHPTSPCLVDLTSFRDGHRDEDSPSNVPFTGRPELIAQLAPAIRELYTAVSNKTIVQVRVSLRAWWRVFDQIEQAAASGSGLFIVRGVGDIGDIHRQVAFERGMTRAVYGPFVRALDVSRRALRLRALHWTGPEEADVLRHLPTFAQIKPIRDALKRSWHSALQRWERAEQLLNGDLPDSDEEIALVANYQHFQEAARASKKACPSGDEIRQGRSSTYFYKQGYRIDTMMRGMYPDAADIRAAFHLCLATTGWNPATFLSLNVEKPFIEPHPRDASRYLLTGYKERSQTHQVTEGLYKSQRSAGVILMTLVERTRPLREQLRVEHAKRQRELAQLQRDGATRKIQDTMRAKIIDLEAGLRSPWLFLTHRGITWLLGDSYQRVGLDGYLERLISSLNARRAPEQQIPALNASDFRDAFAAYAYKESGGMVLYVMRVLGHKRLTSTQRYLDNTLLNEAGAHIFQCFGNSLWKEIRHFGRLDPTVIAKWCRDGYVADTQRQRLEEYRALKRSRLGIGCRNPFNPPKKVLPGFISNGRSLCSTQRCTLCLENAIILPESLSGLAMRKAELLHLQMEMPVSAFSETSFDEELHNTEVALLGFDSEIVKGMVNDWQERIASGLHRVVQFELIGEGRV